MRKHAPYFLMLVFGVLCAGLSGCDTAGNTEDPDLDYFMKYYGGDGNQYGVDMQVLPDGTLLLLGNYSENTFDTDLYLMRVDAQGDVIWELRFGQEQQNTLWDAKDMEPASDGNYIVLANFRAGTGSQSDFGLLKFSPEGTLLDSTMVKYSIANEYGRTVTPLDDGGFIVSGTTEFTSTFALSGHPDPDLGDIFNFRFDANLDVDPGWGPVTTGFGSHLDVAVKTVMAPNGFYVYGHTNSQIQGMGDGRLGLFYFYRQASGTTGGVFYYGNSEPASNTEINAVVPVAPALGSGVVLVGTSTDDFDVSDIYLARLRSSLGFTTQDATYSSIVALNRNLRAVSVASSVAGEVGYLILGNEIRSIGTNIWLSKADQSGHVLWSVTLGSEAENDMGAAVTELPDGKIAVLGTMGLADNQFKMALIKMNRRGRFSK